MHSAAAAARALDNLRRLVRALRISSHAIERRAAVTGAQLFVLRELAAEPAVSIRRLADRTLTDPSSVSVVVARLAERGLVARRRDPDDGRRVVLSLTRRGRGLLARAPEPVQVRLVAAIRALPPARLRPFDQVLTSLVRAIDADGGAPPMFFDDEPRRRRSRRAGQ
jgi:DNA-binding MarR family transcriptional regulator